MAYESLEGLVGLGILAFIMMFFFIFIALLVAFWVWMLVDCARREFNNENEKIVWIVIIALTSTLGALIYLIVIKMINPRGISKADTVPRAGKK